MDIGAIMDELADSLVGVGDLRVTAYYADKVNPPQAVVSFPDPYTFDGTYGRGMDSLDFPIIVFVGRVDVRTARDLLSAYANGSGGSSIKQAVEAHTYTACDSVRVRNCEFGVVNVAGVDYLTAMFTVHVVGSGD